MEWYEQASLQHECSGSDVDEPEEPVEPELSKSQRDKIVEIIIDWLLEKVTRR